jgi:hypothetical protein
MSEERDSAATEPSVIEGGPAYRLLQRIGLVLPKPSRVVLRAILALVVAWVAPLVLTLFDRGAGGHATTLAFLRDAAGISRFILSLPLLILAELPVEARLHEVIRQFRASGLVAAESEPAWNAALGKLRRRVGSGWVEAVALALVVVLACIEVQNSASDVVGWGMTRAGTATTLSVAGWWHALVSRPLYQLVLARWIWRLIAWGLFLRDVSRLNLTLTPTHPDGAAGLGFVGLGQASFALFAFALSVGPAGLLANRVFYEHVAVASLRAPMVGFLVLELLLLLLPLMAFTPLLTRLRWQGQFRYGALAARYAAGFDAKWAHSTQPANEPLLGTADIQSLADMQGSFEPVAKLRTVPIDFTTIRVLVFAAAIPFLPVLCIEIPLQELLKKVLALVM